MSNNILVVGSGFNHEINTSAFDEIYAANTSFLRLSGISNANIIISDALLFEEKDLNDHPTLDGFARNESNKIRLEKYQLIDNLRSKRLIITDSGMNVNFISRLYKKNIKSEITEIIDSKKIWSIFLSTFNVRNLLVIISHLSFYLKIKFLIQLLMRRRMDSYFRPSLGLISIIIAVNENPDASIMINGIGVVSSSGNRYAFYKNQKKLKYKPSSHFLDKVYLDLLFKKYKKLSLYKK